MRARKKKNREKRVEACADLLITEPAEMETYKEKGPFELEIGCGKGGFICEKAKREPHKQFFAVELVTDVLVTALEKAREENIENLKFLNINAIRLPEFFSEGAVSVIYLNFSDPWPKARHYRRRLTYRDFLGIYKRILDRDGVIEMKTDNDGLFDFTLEELPEAGFAINALTRDLHASEYAENNVMTEYEKHFSEQGVPIKYVNTSVAK